MFTGMNGKKYCNGSVFTLIVWLLSMFVSLTALFAAGGNYDLPLKLRVMHPYVATLAYLTGNDYFKNMEREISSQVLIPQGLRMESKLATYKERLDKYCNFDTPEKVYCYYVNKAAIDKANENYDKALKVLDAWHKGDTTHSTIVHETMEQLADLLEVMSNSIGRGNMSDLQFNTETLALTLLNSGSYFEYKIDSVGADTGKYTKESTLFINGYMRFDPEDSREMLIRSIKNFDFSEVRYNNRQKLAIFLLEKDDGSGSVFWGDDSQFNLPVLSALLGFVKNGNVIYGMYSDINVAPKENISIRCNRLDSLAGDDFYTILVDLRPQNWCKWHIAQKSVDEKVFANLKSLSTLEVSGPTHNQSKAPAAVKPGHAAIKHVFFDKASGIAADEVAEVNMPLSKVFSMKNIVKKPVKDFKAAEDSIESPVVKKIAQVFLTPEEKAASAQAKITEGKKIEDNGDYVGAYNLYKQAADLDSDKGRLNCAIMLVQQQVVYKEHNSDVSFELAKKFALETLEKSDNNMYKGIAYNLLGIIHNDGGAGVSKDIALAIKYFERGAKLGNENAQSNLDRLRQEQNR